METGLYESHTVDDYFATSEERHAELIDGFFYDMAAPGTRHQALVGALFARIYNYIESNKGSCQIE